MEIWKEVFKGIIPKDYYYIRVNNSDEDGLNITLDGNENRVIMNFGDVRAIRMLDEGIVQKGVYADSELEKYKKDKFENVIYEVENGKFNKEVSEMSLGFTDIFGVKHYILITENFNIDIISNGKPKLEVKTINQ